MLVICLRFFYIKSLSRFFFFYSKVGLKNKILVNLSVYSYSNILVILYQCFSYRSAKKKVLETSNLSIVTIQSLYQTKNTICFRPHFTDFASLLALFCACLLITQKTWRIEIDKQFCLFANPFDYEQNRTIFCFI